MVYLALSMCRQATKLAVYVVISHLFALTIAGSDVSGIKQVVSCDMLELLHVTSFRADVAEGSCGLGFFSGVRRCEHMCQALYHALGRHLPMD